MPRQYVMTLMAANRTGILAAMCTALDELGGNLLEVSQTVIHGYFTMIIAAEFPTERTPDVIADHLTAVGAPFGVELAIKDPYQDPMRPAGLGRPVMEPYVLTVVGQDRPGSLRQLALRLAQDGVNISDIDAFRRGDGESFQASLQRELEELGRQDGLQMTLQHQRVVSATHDTSPISE
jgi:glycine cleavage system transcriptional repressor